MNEKVYNVREIALGWKVAESSVYRMFREEPGVYYFKRVEASRGSLRIPESVVERVLSRATVKPARREEHSTQAISPLGNPLRIVALRHHHGRMTK